MTIKEAYIKNILINGDFCDIGNLLPPIKINKEEKIYFFNNHVSLEKENIKVSFPFGKIQYVDETKHFYIDTRFYTNEGIIRIKEIIDAICNKLLDYSKLISEPEVCNCEINQYSFYYPESYTIRMQLDENILVRFDNDLELPVLYLPEHEYYSVE